MGTSINTTVDDRDLHIKYNGIWVPISSPLSFNDTFTFTGTKGNNLVYNFTGTRIFVFGTTGQGRSQAFSEDTVATYRIDNLAPYQTVDNSTTPVEQQLLFASPILSNTSHTLTVTKESVDSLYTFDFFIVTSPLSPSSDQRWKNVTERPSTTIQVPIQPTAPALKPSTNPNTSNAAVVGGITAIIVAALIMVVTGVLLWRFRRGKTRRSSVSFAIVDPALHVEPETPDPRALKIDPFLPPRPQRSLRRFLTNTWSMRGKGTLKSSATSIPDHPPPSYPETVWHANSRKSFVAF
ncbi:hypothetical protein M422DRAFT_23512 [Sphaerobolus stellatus SS14]|nr:hypothetical protein M422DRAFT_23512 [Sphaerobolus stellatus SS14]